LAKPIVSTLFERGNFHPTATLLCAGLLPYAAVGLIATAANMVLTRCCFACKETRWTTIASVGTVGLNVALSVLWLPSLGARGLLLANSVSQTAQTVVLFVLVRRLLNGLDVRTLFVSAARIAACAGVMLASLHWIAALGASPDDSFAARGWYLLGQVAIGALVFAGAAKIARVEEIRIAWRMIMDKFERRVMSPSENREAPIA
jgi:putative peptidoglycan lipid II flippase